MRNWLSVWIIIIALSLAGLTGVNVLAAQEAENLDEIFVTATRTEQAIDKIGGSSVSVLTFEEIDAKKQLAVSEILKDIPGIDINKNGGMGTLTSVFTRGADSKNTLILVDGMIFNDPASADRSANIENISTDAIERIEVVRGPMSVLYGSNATGGVINIITKKGTEKPAFSAGAEGGSYETLKYNATLFGVVDQFNYALTGSVIDTEGFSTANDDNDLIPHNGNTSEKDGWENKSLYGKFGYEFSNNFDITTNFMVLDSSLDLDDWYSEYIFGLDAYGGYAGDRFAYDAFWNMVPEPNGLKKAKTDKEQSIGKINIHNYFFNQQLESQLSFQAARHKSMTYDNDGNLNDKSVGKNYDCSWQGGIDLAEIHLLDFGLNYYKEYLTQNGYDSISDMSADTKSIWLQDQFFLNDNFIFVAGVRYDDHENFGGKTTYRVAPAYYFYNTTLKASYGTGFRAPSLYELYSSYGNEDLDAEKSMGWDLGVEQAFLADRAKAGITYFSTTYEDRIGWDDTLIIPGNFYPGGYNQLDGKTKTKGIETFAACQLMPELDLSVDYTYTDTEDPDGNTLVRRPYNKVHFNSRYRFLAKGLLNLDVYWVGERDAIASAMDKNGNLVGTLDAYTLVNVSAHYDFTDHFNLYARVDNVFDEFYETAWSYASPGLSGYVGMKLSYY